MRLTKNLFLKRMASMISKRGEIHFMQILSDLKPYIRIKPLTAFLRALSFVTPVAKLRPYTSGVKVYSVACFCSLEKRQLFGFTLIKKGAFLRKGLSSYDKIFQEVLALNNQEITASWKLKNDVHKSVRETKSLLRKKINKINT